MTQEVTQRFDLTTIIFCVAITVLGTGAVYFASGKALKPIRNLSGEISKIDENNLSQRLTESISKDEISSLTKSFNRVLERLDEAFQRQKRFSASAAHELKTPLATIKAGVQVLMIDEDTPLSEFREHARITEANIDRLARVVNDLLLLASAGEGMEESEEEIHLDSLLDAIFSELTPMYEHLRISIENDCRAITVYGNTSLLYRAFYNLIENAYKYNRENGSISITAEEVDSRVKIDISDTGNGIPQEHLPLIFEAFYRVDASRSRKIAGSGLGLSIVKTIIEKHGGTISVFSEIGKGTVFSVTLPQ